MLSDSFIFDRLRQLAPTEQVECLLKALNILKENSDRSIPACIAMALDIPVFPKVEQIADKNDYILTLRFTNGEMRRLNFRQFFSQQRKFQRILLNDKEQFDQVRVQDGTLVWPELGIWTNNAEGEKQFMSYDLDPAMLYEAAEPAAADAPISK